MKSFAQLLIQEKAQQVEVLKGMLDSNYLLTANEVVGYLLKKKYVRDIGGGRYSLAFAGNGKPDYILKAQFRGARKSDKWPEFAQLSQEKANSNPLFPRIEYLKQMGDGSWIAIMEHLRLAPLELDHRCEHLIEWVNDHTDFDAFKQAKGYGEFTSFSINIIGFLVRGFGGLVIDGAIQEFCTEFKMSVADIEDFAKAVAPLVENRGLGGWDLHNQNAGFRGNGDLVFFDPVQ
jgi:hypothetical protein